MSLAASALLGPPVLAGALVCALAAGLAHLGRRSAGWDVLTHGAPICLLGGLFALAAALVLPDRYRAIALVLGGAAVLAAGLLMVPEFLRSTGPRAPAGAPTFKVIQFNIWAGEGGLDDPAAWLAAQDADVVVIQETNRRVRRTILERTHMHLTLGRSNVAIFSKRPPMSVVALPDGIAGPMTLNGATFETPAGPATVLAVHYPWPTELDRLRQTDDLIALVRSCPPATTIVAGDFNSTPWSFARRRDDREFGLIRRTRARFTWPVGRLLPIPLFPIDHIYAGSAWATVKIETGPNLGSDHLPVVAVLAPAARPPQASAATFIETIRPGSRGGSPFGSASTLSMPSVTLPQTVYLPSR